MATLEDLRENLRTAILSAAADLAADRGQDVQVEASNDSLGLEVSETVPA